MGINVLNKALVVFHYFLVVSSQVAPPEVNCTGIKAKNEWNCTDYETHFEDSKFRNAIQCIGYSHMVPPKVSGSLDPLLVQIWIKIDKIHALDIEQKEIIVTKSYEVSWVDKRLKWPDECMKYEMGDIILSGLASGLIWDPTPRPDGINKMEEIKIRGFFPSTEVYLNASGHAVKYFSVKEHIHCELNFQWFPFDTQICEMVLIHESARPGRNIIMEWAEDRTKAEAFYLANWDVSLKDMFYTSITGEDFDGHNSVNMSAMIYALKFRRNIANQIMHTFVPSIMLSLGSTASVFLPPELVPGRMSLCVTTFLSLISIFNGAKNGWPATSYVKAVDVWALICYTGAFFSLMEYCIVLYFLHKKKLNTVKNEPKQNNNTISKRPQTVEIIESFSRIAMPTFNVVTIACFFLACLSTF